MKMGNRQLCFCYAQVHMEVWFGVSVHQGLHTDCWEAEAVFKDMSTT